MRLQIRSFDEGTYRRRGPADGPLLAVEAGKHPEGEEGNTPQGRFLALGPLPQLRVIPGFIEYGAAGQANNIRIPNDT